MTQTSNRIFDEMARLMGDAANVAQGVKKEAESAVRSQIERFIADMDLVKREEFEVVRDLATKARSENTALKRRITELEKKLEGKASTKAKAATKTTTAKRASAKTGAAKTSRARSTKS